MSNLETGLAIFSYNRPLHLQRTLTSLTRNSKLKECNVYIFLDGLKKDADSELVRNYNATISVIQCFKETCEFEFIRSEINKGVVGSIVDGINYVLERHGQIIVIEDDLELSSCALEYFLCALEKYKKFGNVGTIQGFQFPVKFSPAEELFFDYYVGCWSWATWKSRWNLYSDDIHSLVSKVELNKNKFDLEGSYPFYDLLKNQISKPNSWAILWYASLFVNNMIHLYPTNSFCLNHGNDGKGLNNEKLFRNSVLNDSLPKKWPVPEFHSINHKKLTNFRLSLLRELIVQNRKLRLINKWKRIRDRIFY